MIVVEGLRKLSLKLGKNDNSNMLLILALINPRCLRFGDFMLIQLGSCWGRSCNLKFVCLPFREDVSNEFLNLLIRVIYFLKIAVIES